jgi:AcrR family transcriptional regulator
MLYRVSVADHTGSDTVGIMPSERAASKSRPVRRARGSLSAEEILDAARDLVEKSGLQGLSMPILARSLHSGVTSIYWYFRSKDELLVALTDRVAREIVGELPPVGDGAWDDELFTYFSSFRDLLEAVPVYREAFSWRPQALFDTSGMAPGLLRRLEVGLRLLTDVGMTVEQAAAAFNACSTYTRGFVLLEHGAEGVDAPSRTRVDAALYPLVSQLPSLSSVLSPTDQDFSFGLRLLIDGLGRHYGLSTERPRRARGGRGSKIEK